MQLLQGKAVWIVDLTWNIIKTKKDKQKNNVYIYDSEISVVTAILLLWSFYNIIKVSQ